MSAAKVRRGHVSASSSRGRDLLKNAGIIGVGTMCTKALSFFLLPLYTALLSTEDYGTLDLVMTITSLLTPVVNLQLAQGVFRFATEHRRDEDEVSTILTVVAAESLVLLCVYVVVFSLAYPFLTLSYKGVLLPSVIASVLLQLATCAARGIGDNVAYAVGSFVSAAVTVIFNVVLLVVFNMGLDGMMVAMCIGPLCGFSIVCAMDKLWRYVKPELWSWGEARRITAYALPLVPEELSWWVLQSSDRVVISAAIGVAANGLVAVATKFSTIYASVFSVFNASWKKQVILHYHDEDGKSFIRKTADATVRAFTAFLLLIVAAMPFLYPAMVGDGYEDAYPMVPIYLLAVYSNLFTGLVSPVYFVNNESGKAAQASIASAVINLVLLAVFVGPLGVYAAPVSTAVSYGSVAILRVVDVERRHVSLGLSRGVLVGGAISIAVVVMLAYSSNWAVCALGLTWAVIYSIYVNRKSLMKVASLSVRIIGIEKD